MKTAEAHIHKRNPHSHRHRIKPIKKNHARQPGLSGENEFLPEPPKAGVRPSREKAASEFLRLE